jgi:hypothetical protein
MEHYPMRKLALALALATAPADAVGGIRFWEHSYPTTTDLLGSQSNASESDQISCGSQTIIGWNYIAKSGAHFMAKMQAGSASVVISGLTGTGQTVRMGDSFAMRGTTGRPNIATTPSGASSTIDGTYTLTAPQSATIGPTDAFTMTEDWSQTDALAAQWATHGKYVNFLFASAAAQTPQEMDDIGAEFTVQASTTNGSPYLIVTGLTGSGHQICIGDGGIGGGLKQGNTAYVYSTNKGFALNNNIANWCSNTDGAYVLSYNATSTNSNEAVTVVPKQSFTPSYVLGSGLTPIVCDPTSSNQPDPPAPNYLDDRYNIPHHRFMHDVVARYGNDSRIAALHFPFSGMESFPMAKATTACTNFFQSLGYTGDTWLAHAKSEVDYLKKLNSPVQLEFDVNSQWQEPSSGGDFVTQASQYITADGFTTGSNGFPQQSFNTELWGTFCPMCYAETVSMGNQPAPDYLITTIIPEAESFGIPSMHLYSKEFTYADTTNSYQTEFDNGFAAVPPVQGPACRIPAGQH